MDGLDSAGNHKVFENIIGRLEQQNIAYSIHWGKLNAPLNKDRISAIYGDKLIKWRQSRAQLLSAEVRTVFSNPFMEKCGLNVEPDWT